MRAGTRAARFVTLSVATALAACATAVDPESRGNAGDASAGSGPLGGTSGASGFSGSSGSNGQGGSAAFGTGGVGGTFGAGGRGGSSGAGSGGINGSGGISGSGSGSGGNSGTNGTSGSAGTTGSGGTTGGASGTGMGGVGGVPTGCDCSRPWVANQPISPPLTPGQCMGYMGGMYEYAPENTASRLDYGHANCPPGNWSAGDCKWFAKLIYRGMCP